MSIQWQFPGDLLQPCVALHIVFFSLPDPVVREEDALQLFVS